jgi:hypothetical protein
MIDTILLFDMDGVLLEPRGYHRALQQTVRILAQSLGFQGADLSQEEIFHFESLGITSEWDSAAVCHGLLLKSRWEQTAAQPPGQVDPPGLALQSPDWTDFLSRVEDRTAIGQTSLQAAAKELEANLSGEKHRQVHTILKGAHQPTSRSHRIFQELVLGSETFREIYRLQPHLDTESYLAHYDQPGIPPGQLQALKGWFNPRRRGAVVTNRPTRPAGADLGSPEGEMGAEHLGLGDLPLIGYGEISWLAGRENLPTAALRKPSPVHTLAGLLAAVGLETSEALVISRQLTAGKSAGRAPQLLHQARAIMYEDTTAGLKSLKTAARTLATSGIQLKITLVGIAGDDQKKQALEKEGAAVYPSLSDALRAAPGITPGAAAN